ncbi:MAG: hypothetical protein H6657_00055 [Ardenticatenaceae bacterium]|nr:hypothetical protein [Ardenticatenaceae bacterium]
MAQKPGNRLLFRLNGQFTNLLSVLLFMFLPVPVATAQQEQVILTVRLRFADGTPVVAEPIELARLPEPEPVLASCRTDASGQCSWSLTRGLYEIRFAQSLDRLSALALAEGGLAGLGITVGDVSITYHFTFHEDGYVYFDAAPLQSRPVPVIPSGNLLLGGVQPSPTPTSALSAKPSAPSGIPGPTGAATTGTVNSEASPALLSLWPFVGAGALLGIGIYWWTHRRNKQLLIGSSLAEKDGRHD